MRRPTEGVADFATALEWYRKHVCRANGHTHGAPGELACIVRISSALRAMRIMREQIALARA
jgi:hypothetical protein